MKRSIERKILLGIIILVVALPAAGQTKKKTSVKTEYDKFKDITCASVNFGDIVPFRAALSQEPVFMDASYCSRGQSLDSPTRIQLRFRSRDASWLSGMREPTMGVIFLFETTERLALSGKYEYVIDKVLGAVSQVTVQAAPDELLQMAKAKTVEFQISNETFKLNQKDLAKLKDLAESGAGTNR